MDKKVTIAVDGYSSCGKSTMAKHLAKMIGYTYVDTGAMYRAIALYAIRNGFIDGEKVNVDMLKGALDKIVISFAQDGSTLLNGENVETQIRSLTVSRSVSYVSAIPEVRKHLVFLQRQMGKSGGIVMDGRDIGTVVFPNAELKIFVTADASIRAQRRYDELKAKGQQADYNDILENVKQRDFLDETRKESPLKRADDAILLDNGKMTIEEQNVWLMDQYKRVCGI